MACTSELAELIHILVKGQHLLLGASTFHKGIDIGAPEGFEFVAVTDGMITFVGFLGGGGYTITLTDLNTENRRNQIFLLSLQP